MSVFVRFFPHNSHVDFHLSVLLLISLSDSRIVCGFPLLIVTCQYVVPFCVPAYNFVYVSNSSSVRDVGLGRSLKSRSE